MSNGLDQEEKEINSKEEAEEVINTALREPLAMPKKGEKFDRCIICKRVVLNKKAVGETLEKYQTSHLRIDCIHKKDQNKHTILYICQLCRFNQILVSKVSQAVQGIFADTDFKTINCQHE